MKVRYRIGSGIDGTMVLLPARTYARIRRAKSRKTSVARMRLRGVRKLMHMSVSLVRSMSVQCNDHSRFAGVVEVNDCHDQEKVTVHGT